MPRPPPVTTPTRPASGVSLTRPRSARGSGHRAAREPALLEVALVVVLGAVERRCRRDLGDDRAVEAGLHAVAHLGRDAGLLGVVEEDRRAVLRADVRSLAVELRGIVQREELLDELLVGDLGRIEVDLHDLGVPRAPRAHLLVGRLRQRAAEVADRGPAHSGRVAELDLDAPEAAGAEG